MQVQFLNGISQAKGQALSKALALARAEEARTLEVADELFILIQWMRQDVLALIGPQASIRQALYDWIVEQLQARSGFASHRIGPLVRKLANHFFRSESPHREGKSPAEVLTGKAHPHWLRLLGFQPFQKAA